MPRQLGRIQSRAALPPLVTTFARQDTHHGANERPVRKRCSPRKQSPATKVATLSWQWLVGHTPCTNDRAYVRCSHPHTPTKTRTQELTPPHEQPGSLVGVAHKVRHSLSQTDIAPGRKQHHCASASSRLSLPSSPSKWEYEMVSRCRQRYKPTTILTTTTTTTTNITTTTTATSTATTIPADKWKRKIDRKQPDQALSAFAWHMHRTPCVPQPQPDDAQGRGRCTPSTAHRIVTVVTLLWSWPTACNQRRNSYLRTCASAITKPRRLMLSKTIGGACRLHVSVWESTVSTVPVTVPLVASVIRFAPPRQVYHPTTL